MGVKKNKKLRKTSILLFVLAIVLVLCLIGALIVYVFKWNKPYYKVKSHLNDITEQRELDDDGYQTIGWLDVQGTNIDMPIVHSVDDDYPVTKEKYAWYYRGDGKFHNEINIMGHNIFNLSSTPQISSERFNRFEELMSYVYYDVAKKNKYIQYTMDGKDYVYKIFAAGFIGPSTVMLFPKLTDDVSKEELSKQIKMLRKVSLYKYDVDVNADDSIISLLTCTRFFIEDGVSTDFVVSGRLLRKGEKMNDYNVVINDDNYDKVKEKLKGDENGEEDSV